MTMLDWPNPSVSSRWRVACTTSDSGLAELAADWNALAGPIPFRSFEWLATWWRHYRRPTDQLFVLTIRDEQGELVGVAPWYRQRSAWWGRSLRFLGDGEVCSDYLSLLSRAELAEPVAAAAANFLLHEAARDWDLMQLSGAAEGDSSVETLVNRLAAAGCTPLRRQSSHCWRVALPDGWEPFLKRLSKSRRERTRSILRRVLESGRGRRHCVEQESQLPQAFDLLVQLHQKRRHSLGEPGCFASSRFAAFHREAMVELWRAGRLRLSWLEIDGRPASAEYSLLGGDTVYYYQGGFEPELADERPGWLSLAVALRDAIESGYQHFDFLRGDESYKASWRAEPQAICDWWIAHRRGPARWKLAAWQSVRRMRERLASRRAPQAPARQHDAPVDSRTAEPAVVAAN